MKTFKLDNMSLEALDYDDLTSAINALMKEKERRAREEAERDWLKVRNAISEYLNKYSEMIITCANDKIWLTDGCIDTTEIGVIDCR